MEDPSSNPFSPPKAVVADVPTAPYQQGTPFFAVSTRKLAVMFLCTFSLYQYFWFYKNWKILRDQQREKLSPVLRTVFAPVFCYALFSRIRRHDAAPADAKLAAGPLSVVWIVLSLLGNLPEPYFFLGFFSLVPLLTVQTVVNDINAVAAKGHDPNNAFSPINWLAIVIGVLFTLLALVGTLIS
ncbi:hypothetical protein [Aquabacterium sp.]|uniref:hypothetical protein n=1 Tax=Aquabacterium sp. TaxID=1872578 RepID=UPI003D6D4C3C